MKLAALHLLTAMAMTAGMFSISYAAQVTYYSKVSNGISIATDVTTNHSFCATDPTGSYIEELSTNLVDLCATAYRWEQ